MQFQIFDYSTFKEIVNDVQEKDSVIYWVMSSSQIPPAQGGGTRYVINVASLDFGNRSAVLLVFTQDNTDPSQTLISDFPRAVNLPNAGMGGSVPFNINWQG